MTTPVLLAVLFAAFLHALWNAMIKMGTSKVTGSLILTILQGVAGIAIALTRPWPEAEVWLWVAGSGLFHMGYMLFLSFAYEQGDLSRVYPIARGGAPLVVLLISSAYLSDVVTGIEIAGILVLGLGIVGMARDAFTSRESRRLVPYALGSAMMTAGYTLVDGLGARVSGDPVAYVGWLFSANMVFLPIALYVLRGPQVFVAPPCAWLVGAGAAAASYGAYAIAVWAMTVAPIALVSAVRETSILFAVLMGWLVFGERMTRAKAVSALLIVGGVALTRL